jgi:manganese/zinc/iron transport system ATP- binding protein
MSTGKQPIALEAHNLTVSYGTRPVLWEVDFELPSGVMAGVLGPNGSGKSTLLKTIMGLLDPLSGYVEVFGKSLDESRKRVSYVPQRESVDWDFPASVFDVVMMGRYLPGRFGGRAGVDDRKIVMEALDRVGMSSYANRQISRLSGGQQQRVFLARALARQADLYLLDEPFAGVDAASERAILEVLQSMKNEGKTLVIVHHDLHTAREFFDWFILLNTRLVVSGTKERAFTDKALGEAYGGALTPLSRLADKVKDSNFPVRE